MLPEQICVLDIETADNNFKKKNLSDLNIAIVGVKVYVLRDSEYVPVEYKCFLADQMPEMAVFLASFPGIIVGHNILEFDYQVLRSHLSLEGIIARTADTLMFLHGLNDRVLKGLSLDNLAMMNLGVSKSLSGKCVPAMWLQGHREEVISYNEKDCDLTQRLWWQMVKEKQVILQVWEDGEPDIIELDKADVSCLLCEKPLLDHATWKKRVDESGRLMERYYKHREKYVSYSDWEPEAEEIMYFTYYCDQCNKTSLFETQIFRGNADYEVVYCPKCNKALGEVRDDLGTPVCLGTVEGNCGQSVFQGMAPIAFEAIMRERMEATRLQWEVPSGTLPLGDQCGICRRPPLPQHDLFTNPVDDSPICMECLTAGRWLLSIK